MGVISLHERQPAFLDGQDAISVIQLVEFALEKRKGRYIYQGPDVTIVIEAKALSDPQKQCAVEAKKKSTTNEARPTFQMAYMTI